MYKRWSFNEQDEILPKELAIGSTVNSHTFFKEINNDWSFHLPEDMTFFIDHCARNFFSVFPLNELSVRL